MNPPKFDGTTARTIIHWLLAVEQCGVAQIIEDDTRIISYAMSHMRGNASEWAYSALMTDSKAFQSWAIFENKYSVPCISRRTIKFCFRQASLSRDKQGGPARICAGDAFAVGIY